MTKRKYSHLGVDHSIERVLKAEGGYVNHKDDLGGETNLGITIATAKANKDLWSKYNWNGDMRTLPRDLAKAIYKRNYWDKVGGDHVHQIHPLLADHLFDFAVNAGTGRAVQHLQRGLNALNNKQVHYKDVAVDGSMGNGTLSSLRAYANRRGEEGLDRLVFLLVSMQMQHYTDISEKRERNETFTYGWLERAYKKMTAYITLINKD